MRWNWKESQICAYCGVFGPVEKEHVIGKQFFPSEGTFRGDLIIVPSCNECNRKKGQIEDMVVAFLPFSDGGVASKTVIETHLMKMFPKNKRLLEKFREAFQEDFYRDRNGKFARRVVIRLDTEMLNSFLRWVKYVVRGTYREFKGENIPSDHRISVTYLSEPNSSNFLEQWVTGLRGAKVGTLANGEFKYKYALGVDGIISSAWIFAIYNFKIFATTHNVKDSSVLENIEKTFWKELY